MTLEQALSVEGITAHVDRYEQRIDIYWIADDLEPGGIVDFQHGYSVGEATFDLEAKEWTRFMVAPQARNRGIFTAALSLDEELCRREGLWPQRIHVAASSLPFYKTAGFEEDPEDPSYVVKMQDRAQAWLSR